MDVEAMFPSRFIKAADLQGKEVTVEIAGTNLDELDGDGGKKVKGIVTFAGKKKKWVLNRTNAMCLKAMFGRDTDQWKGHKVTLYPTTFNDEPCVRVKGSPELKAPLEFELKLPKKKPRLVKLMPTGAGASAEFDDGPGAQSESAA